MSRKKGVILQKNNKSSFYSFWGITMILTLMTFISWILINLMSVKNSLKENIAISVYLNNTDIDTVQLIKQYISKQKYAQNIKHIDKEEAKKIWLKQKGSNWGEILDFNPLPESIDFTAKARYINQDSLSSISAKLLAKFPKFISSVEYPVELIENMQNKIKKFSLVLVAIAIGLGFIMISIINSTINLSIHNNRFLIKTMQLVGASHTIIQKPFVKKAFVNGLISSIIALGLFWILLSWALNSFLPLKRIENLFYDGGLSIFIIIVGTFISVVSTKRTINKYLKVEFNSLH